MAISTLRRNILFFAVSALAGVAIALLVMRVWPQLVRAPGTAVGVALPTFRDPPEQPAPEAVAQPTATPPAAADPLLAQSVDGSFAPAVQASAPAVVAVYTRRTVTQRVPNRSIDQLLGAPSERLIQRTQQGLGSGVIVDAQGHIITNEHVIAGWDQISVQLADGRTAEAQVVGRDPDTELAVLKISLPDMPVMQLGRSDRIAVGDVVLAIGTPLGLSQTVTHGIVSATGRAQLGVATYENFIQTDAAISLGNSGGALVNTRGELIGINTAVLGKAFGAEGIGVAIPVDLVRGVMREILQHGRVIRGWIGIVPEDIGENEFSRLGLPHAGVAVSNLYRNSPALEAGLQRGDMIETIDGQPVRSAQDTLTRIAARKPGSTVRLTGMRGTENFTRDLQVVEAPQRRVQ